jgi:hypothetical protein
MSADDLPIVPDDNMVNALRRVRTTSPTWINAYPHCLDFRNLCT